MRPTWNSKPSKNSCTKSFSNSSANSINNSKPKSTNHSPPSKTYKKFSRTSIILSDNSLSTKPSSSKAPKKYPKPSKECSQQPKNSTSTPSPERPPATSKSSPT
jgi:hypothetical protein